MSLYDCNFLLSDYVVAFCASMTDDANYQPNYQIIQVNLVTILDANPLCRLNNSIVCFFSNAIAVTYKSIWCHFMTAYNFMSGWQAGIQSCKMHVINSYLIYSNHHIYLHARLPMCDSTGNSEHPYILLDNPNDSSITWCISHYFRYWQACHHLIRAFVTCPA